MDTEEIAVLAKKEFLLLNYLQWNEVLRKALTNDRIISEEYSEQIQKAGNYHAKTRLMLDYLLTRGSTKSLDLLSSSLDATRRSFGLDWANAWISDELRAELEAKRLTLTISDDISHESAQLVHRKFGHDKKLAEFEKKTIAEVISLSTQLTMNVWSNQYKRLQDSVAEEQRRLEENKLKCMKAVTEIDHFINDNVLSMSDINSLKKDLGTSTSMSLVPKTEETPLSDKDLCIKYLTDIRASVAKLTSMVGRILLDIDSQYAEFDRALRIVGLQVDCNPKDMHKQLRDAIQTAAAENTEAQENIKRIEDRYKEVLQELEQEKIRQQSLLKGNMKHATILLTEYSRTKHKVLENHTKMAVLIAMVRHARAENKEMHQRHSELLGGDRVTYIYKRDAWMMKGENAVMREPDSEDEVEESQSKYKNLIGSMFPDIEENRRRMQSAKSDKSEVFTPRPKETKNTGADKGNVRPKEVLTGGEVKENKKKIAKKVTSTTKLDSTKKGSVEPNRMIKLKSLATIVKRPTHKL